MSRIITQKRLRDYALTYPQAKASLEHWERTVLAAQWKSPHDLKATFKDVDPVRVKSGNVVYVFNIQRNEHRLIAAIHFNTALVYVLALMPHRTYDRGHWKEEL